ncbi:MULTISPECIES: phosphopantetheine-binding protein [unclassified Micromonospora]|uniref:phosphopantetheine-binding protein n=1 Tax=unclassified Micromonospora TaxID=2617518 RepID=UPI00363D977A
MTTPLTLAELRADVAELLFLEADEVPDDANLFEEGLDSIRALELVERWRSRGAEVSFVDLVEQPTVTAWWTLIGPPAAGATDA